MIRVKDRKALDPSKVSSEALLVLRCVRENARVGRSNKLSDLKAALEESVTLEFDSYFFFLRKHHYISLDHRDGQLKLTDSGDRLVEGQGVQPFVQECSTFFADQMGQEKSTSNVIRKKSERAEEDAHTTSSPMPPPPLPAPPMAPLGVSRDARGEPDGRYLKMEAMGSGPLGTVYRGKHQSLGTDVCIKELKDIFGYFSFLQRGEVVRRLRQEICAQAQLNHPSIVAVLDQHTEAVRPYYVMTLMQGSLRQKLERAGGKPLPLKTTLRYFWQAASALRVAHAAGLTHHNLKPENLLLDVYGNVHLSDFGLARVIEVDPAKGLPQVFVGTGGMAYLSPELLAKSKDAGPAADVYALGVLLYEMLTGQVPGRRSPMPSEVNDEVSKGIDQLFDRMSDDRMEKRLPDMDAALGELNSAILGTDMSAQGDLLLWSSPPTTP